MVKAILEIFDVHKYSKHLASESDVVFSILRMTHNHINKLEEPHIIT